MVYRWGLLRPTDVERRCEPGSFAALHQAQLGLWRLWRITCAVLLPWLVHGQALRLWCLARHWLLAFGSVSRMRRRQGPVLYRSGPMSGPFHTEKCMELDWRSDLDPAMSK